MNRQILLRIFVFVKRKIYTISLLLSFLVLLSHETIPHHHHDFELDEFSSFHKYDEQYSHHKTDDNHNHDVGNQKHNHSNDSEKEHNHTFPFHHHISPTNDFDYLRFGSLRNIVFNLSLFTVLNSFANSSISEPPELGFIRFTDKPFFVTTIFEPGAIGLRAPPSIA